LRVRGFEKRIELNLPKNGFAVVPLTVLR
jgi:hypothetical protein